MLRGLVVIAGGRDAQVVGNPEIVSSLIGVDRAAPIGTNKLAQDDLARLAWQRHRRRGRVFVAGRAGLALRSVAMVSPSYRNAVRVRGTEKTLPTAGRGRFAGGGYPGFPRPTAPGSATAGNVASGADFRQTPAE